MQSNSFIIYILNIILDATTLISQLHNIAYIIGWNNYFRLHKRLFDGFNNAGIRKIHRIIYLKFFSTFQGY